jgi:hypothetical protein
MIVSRPLELVESRVHTYKSQKPKTPRERHPRIYTPPQTPPPRRYKTNPRHTNEHHAIHRNVSVTNLFHLGYNCMDHGSSYSYTTGDSMNHWGSNRSLSQSKKRWIVSPWILPSFVYNPGIRIFCDDIRPYSNACAAGTTGYDINTECVPIIILIQKLELYFFQFQRFNSNVLINWIDSFSLAFTVSIHSLFTMSEHNSIEI